MTLSNFEVYISKFKIAFNKLNRTCQKTEDYKLLKRQTLIGNPLKNKNNITLTNKYSKKSLKNFKKSPIFKKQTLLQRKYGEKFA